MANEDERYMRLALCLARRGVGRTSPNPPVGAVVVGRGAVVGRGVHRRAGAAHAEVEALCAAGDRARGASLYVTLEPCAHFGHTPPCTAAIRAAGIRRVIIGCRDPNPKVRGNGAGRLRRAGIAVQTAVLEAECEELIRAFRKAVLTGLPWVSLKLAASLDGRIAARGGSSRWLTGAPARRLVHRWRDTHDAVLVGCNTIRQDDPELTCRRRGGRNPLRVVLDGRLRIPLGAQVVSGDKAAGTIVVTQRPTPQRKARLLRARGVTLLELPGQHGHIPLRAVLLTLCRRGINSILIEGGAHVAAAAVRERVVDRLLLFYAPRLVGGDGHPMIRDMGVRQMPEAVTAKVDRWRKVGEDLLVEAHLAGPVGRVSSARRREKARAAPG